MVYVADRERLRVRAAVGAGAERALGFEIGSREGLAGLVAASGEPVLIRDAAQDPRVLNPALRHGIRAVYAVPLSHEGRLIGVAIMGSATAYDFSSDDKQLFRVMAQRAASIIIEAGMLERERAARAELARRERELARVFELSPDMIAVIGADGRVRTVNAAFASVLGHPETDIVGRSYLALVHANDRERLIEQVRSVLAGEPAHLFTFRVRRKDGGTRWVSFNAAADPGGDAFIAAGRDVTAEREQAAFEQQLIGIVSHDLRNPLSTILMSTTVLVRRADELDAATYRSIGRIHAAAERASVLIRDLLDFTRARAAGGIPLTPELADVHALVRTVAEEVHTTYPQRAIALEEKGSGDALVDPSRVGQVVQNLVSNAFKYGSPDAPVRVRSLGGDRWIRLEVHNGGAPIDPALIPHIFEPLRQGKPGTGGGGLGLGLYIVDHIVRAHGGTVDVHSTAAEGTTFIVRLPREPPGQGEAVPGRGGQM
jgi:PAS domain S-box-containing protein